MADPALLHNWGTGRLIRPTLLLTSALGVTKTIRMEGSCVKRVFSIIVLALETTFYLVVLLCTVLLLMGEFYVDDKYPLRKSESLGIEVMFFCLLFCVVKNGASDGIG
jgi:hypothetical protein